MKKISVELKTYALNYILAAFSLPLKTTKPFQDLPILTSIPQNRRPGLAIGHQALGSLVWVGESWSQAWGEYNTDRDMNYWGRRFGDRQDKLAVRNMARKVRQLFQRTIG